MHFYFLFDVSASMPRVDQGRLRYEILPKAQLILKEGSELRIYVFSDSLLGHSYRNDGLLPAPGHDEFKYYGREFEGSSERTSHLRRIEKRYSGDNRVEIVAKLTAGDTPAAIADKVRDLRSEQPDRGWFTDVAQVLNFVYYEHIASDTESEHHIFIVTDGLSDPFPDHQVYGEPLAERITTLDRLLKEHPKLPTLNKINQFSELYPGKIRAHELRSKAIIKRLLEANTDIHFLIYPRGQDPEVEEYLRAIGSSRVTHDLVKGGQLKTEQLISAFLKLKNRVGFDAVYSISIDNPVLDSGYYSQATDFDIPFVMAESATLRLMWRGVALASPKDFQMELTLTSPSGKVISYQIPQSVESQDNLNWDGQGAVIKMPIPEPGTWRFDISVSEEFCPQQRCFDFELDILTSHANLRVAQRQVSRESADRCSGQQGWPGGWEVPLIVDGILRILGDSSPSIELTAICHSDCRNNSGWNLIEPILALSQDEDFFLCLARSLRRPTDGYYELMPWDEDYLLRIRVRGSTRRDQQTVVLNGETEINIRLTD